MASSLLSFQNDGFSNSDLVTVIEPEIEVTSDTELIFDSNDTNEVFVDVGEDVTTVGATVAVYRASEIGEFGVDVSFGTGGAETIRAFVNDTEAITLGAFEFYSQWTMQGADIALRADLP